MALNRELEGLLVVSMEQAVAAPYCGLLLADAGARVIKVERPEGDFARLYDKGADGNSVFFAWLNRGKQSIAIDLNNDDDAHLLHAIVDDADIFLSNLAPGALERRGFGWGELSKTNPGLISCSISGYGRDGGNKKAYDFLVQGESGLCSVTGTDSQPSRVGVSMADISTGLTAFSAILRALIQRGRSGEGVDLDISMFDVLADWMNMPLLSERYLGGAPPRLGLTHALIAPYGAFPAKDGSQVLLSVQSNREWKVFCEQVLGQPALAEDPRFVDNPDRLANRDQIHVIINGVFSKLERAEVMSKLDEARIANAQLSSVADLSTHEFLKNQSIQFAGKSLKIAELPVPTDARRPDLVPLLDEHGLLIRQEFANQEPA